MENKKDAGIGLGIVAALIIIGVLFIGFNFFKSEENNKELKKDMKKSAIHYFNNYMSVNSTSSAYKITLKMLKDANQDGENYNLESLKNCDENKTVATVTIDFSSGKVKNTEIKLKC